MFGAPSDKPRENLDFNWIFQFGLCRKVVMLSNHDIFVMDSNTCKILCISKRSILVNVPSEQKVVFTFSFFVVQAYYIFCLAIKALPPNQHLSIGCYILIS